MAMEMDFIPVKGIRLAAIAAGIKYMDRNDLVLMELPEQATTAAVFTQNAFCAAPVTVAKQHLQQSAPRYLLINSGNANAGTGEPGMQSAKKSCEYVAKTCDCESKQVLPFSTGVIGMQLDSSKIDAALPQLAKSLDENNWPDAAKAIMTTDTRPKLISVQREISGHKVTVTGISKGSGMIRPDMATMLAYVTTDALVSQDLLQQCLTDAVAPSFNSITIDGDTSTNDACVLVASGAGQLTIAEQNEDYRVFSEMVTEVCMHLAREIVLDGEGATKLLDIRVENAADEKEARDVAYTIAHSPLVKTAMFASDPNWGRILAAVGRAGVQQLDINKIQIWLGDVCIVENGGVSSNYTEEAGQQVMDQSEILIRVDLQRGQANANVLSCDLSYDYIKINAEYRT